MRFCAAAFTGESMSYLAILFIKVIVIVSVFACLQSAANIAAAEKKTGSRPDWQKVVEAAKAEGQLTIYSGAIPALIINEGVSKRDTPRSNRNHHRGWRSGRRKSHLAERRAEKHVADLVLGTSSSLWTLPSY